MHFNFFFSFFLALPHRYYYGHTAQLNLRGQTVINSFVPYADDVEVGLWVVEGREGGLVEEEE